MRKNWQWLFWKIGCKNDKRYEDEYFDSDRNGCIVQRIGNQVLLNKRWDIEIAQFVVWSF